MKNKAKFILETQTHDRFQCPKCNSFFELAHDFEGTVHVCTCKEVLELPEDESDLLVYPNAVLRSDGFHCHTCGDILVGRGHPHSNVQCCKCRIVNVVGYPITEEVTKVPTGTLSQDKYEQFYTHIDQACEHMKKLLRQKNTGYSHTGEQDPMINFRFPDPATVLAMYEHNKLSRLKGYIHTKQDNPKEFHEIMQDTAGYALIGMAWCTWERGFEDETKTD